MIIFSFTRLIVWVICIFLAFNLSLKCIMFAVAMFESLWRLKFALAWFRFGSLKKAADSYILKHILGIVVNSFHCRWSYCLWWGNNCKGVVNRVLFAVLNYLISLFAAAFHARWININWGLWDIWLIRMVIWDFSFHWSFENLIKFLYGLAWSLL